MPKRKRVQKPWLSSHCWVEVLHPRPDGRRGIFAKIQPNWKPCEAPVRAGCLTCRYHADYEEEVQTLKDKLKEHKDGL